MPVSTHEIMSVLEIAYSSGRWCTKQNLNYVDYREGIIITHRARNMCESIVAARRRYCARGFARVRLQSRDSLFPAYAKSPRQEMTPRQILGSALIFRRKRTMRTVEVEERNWTCYVREGAATSAALCHGCVSHSFTDMPFSFFIPYFISTRGKRWRFPIYVFAYR